MLRNVGAVIAGYIVIFITIFVTFSIAYLILGTEGSFQEGTYEVSFTWVVLGVLLGIAAALLGGFICFLIAKNQTAVKWLAGLVIVLGLLTAILDLTADKTELPAVREASVESMDAMMNARQPGWFLIVNPLIGAAGVIIGGGLKKEEEPETEEA